MNDEADLQKLDQELEGFTQRIAALNAARETYPEGTLERLDAALVELGLAEDELHACRDALSAHSDTAVERDAAADRERSLLQDTFQSLPFPVFMLDHAGSIRRANGRAADLLGKNLTYINGKPFPVFVETSARATFRSRLAAVERDGRETSFQTTLLRRGQAQEVKITLVRMQARSEVRPVVVATVSSAGSPATSTETPQVAELPADEDQVVAIAARLDLMSTMTRYLLDQGSLQEPVAQQRAVRLLTKESADWAVIDVMREHGMHRSAVAGPDDHEGLTGTHALEMTEPDGSYLQTDVLASGNSVLLSAIDDENALGTTSEGHPLLEALRAVSLICVPLRDEDGVLGTLTLVRREGRPEFGLSDLGVIEEIGAHLALGLRSERAYQRRADVADALQASLLPRTLPQIAGLDVAVSYRAATQGTEVGGDFYDLFGCADGWRFVLGDVCGKGEEAAAATAMVRHGVRVVSADEPDPAVALRQVNRTMVAHGESDRFVTAVAAQLAWKGDEAHLRLVSAGHPRGIVLRADGSLQFVDGGGVPLGIFSEAQLHTHELALGSGDALLLYSDGVTEARKASGEFYGEEGLAESLARCLGYSAASVLQAVETDINTYSSGMSSDDVALLAVRVEP